ncbi:hypothetical protein D3C87_1614670 [compost metagenome]
MDYRSRQFQVLHAKHHCVAEGCAAGQCIAVHTEIAQALPRAGTQTGIGQPGHSLCIAEDGDLLSMRHAHFGVDQLPRFQPRPAEHHVSAHALTGHLSQERAQA